PRVAAAADLLFPPLLPLLRAVPGLEGVEALHAQAVLAVQQLQGGGDRRAEGGVTGAGRAAGAPPSSLPCPQLCLCLRASAAQATSPRRRRRHPWRGG